MIIVHHLNNSKSQRILWLLEELELPYEIRHYKRSPTGLAPPELQRVHPLGKAPAVEIDGQVMAESSAVAEYVLGRHGKGRLAPDASSPDYPRYLELLHYAESSASMPIVMAVFAKIYGLGESEQSKALIASQAEQHLKFIEGLLMDRDYLVGNNFTAADLQITFILQMARDCSTLLNGRTRILDFCARMEARPAYKRAIEKGGPFSLKFFG